MRKGKDPDLEPDPDPYLWVMDPAPDPRGMRIWILNIAKKKRVENFMFWSTSKRPKNKNIEFFFRKNENSLLKFYWFTVIKNLDLDPNPDPDSQNSVDLDPDLVILGPKHSF